VPSKTAVDQEDRLVGRFDTRHLGPPRSIAATKHLIASLEQMEVSAVKDIYMSVDDDAPAEDTVKILRAPGNHGRSLNNPLAVSVAKGTSGAGMRIAATSSSMGSTGPEEPKLSSEEDKVSSVDLPRGWRRGTVTRGEPCLSVLLKH
jgi:hypothetical protein